MTNRFQNQVAIITGGAEGLGKGIALRIASEGGKVALFDINSTLLEKTVNEIKDKGAVAEGYVVNIADEQSVRQTIQKVATNFGRLDIMVNSAGIIGPTSTKITDYPTEEFDKIYSVNLRGSFLMTKHAITLMEKNNYGRILLTHLTQHNTL